MENQEGDELLLARDRQAAAGTARGGHAETTEQLNMLRVMRDHHGSNSSAGARPERTSDAFCDGPQ